jgi:hypothetical protein
VDDIPPKLRDFVLFCAQRRTPEWPAIYDEMTKVAGRKLFEGLGYEELRQLGLSFSLSSAGRTIELVREVTSGNQR